jgi:Tfp pilus assembly protein PilN
MLSQPTHIAACSSRTRPSRRHVRLRVILGILMAANALLLYFWFRSPGRTETEWRQELAQLETEEHAAQLRVQRLQQLEEKVRDATHNEQQFAQASFLRRSSAFSQMLTDLERLAADNHLVPGDAGFNLDDRNNQLGWVTVQVTLTVNGNYPDLVRFLNQLEQSKLFWIVESLTVSSKTGQNLTLNLQAATYLLPS